MSTWDIAAALARTTDRLAAAAQAAGRAPEDVALVVATKSVDVARTLEAVAAGACLLGESRVQDVVAKAPALEALDAQPAVHLIGPLQSNKINAALRHVACVETVHSASLAAALGARCVRDGRVLDVLVQVNVSGEEQKSGVTPDAALDLALEVAATDGLRLRGLMTIGRNSPVEAEVRAGYARLRTLRDEVVTQGARGATELSMGMSGDLEWAVAEGATIVRVGTAIVGPRV
ncbi:YggS family pyridoxal phosphate-dependent enzyme [Sanguibacter sp. HDW7]|uniref:YggS family pyridoxal phosphate-dependent enzyme n=1 Tax=Sanguibacter sp. HDW7 TaxID=2714931 RepID=UPI00140DA133|nr:YggS family pyridoxal phosphate-dependent enzyme [Sanguibacter sp. HDW7]QIK83926.1 YggS family pyridoxal phosphate-dependent enzyme [Sanguibacter sp. HDW7]